MNHGRKIELGLAGGLLLLTGVVLAQGPIRTQIHHSLGQSGPFLGIHHPASGPRPTNIVTQSNAPVDPTRPSRE